MLSAIWPLDDIETRKNDPRIGRPGREQRTDYAYKLATTYPYVVDDTQWRSGFGRISAQVPNLPQMQDGFRQRMGGRANLPALQRKHRLAEWRDPAPNIPAQVRHS